MLTEGTLTPALHRSVSMGRAMLPRTFVGVPAPSSSISHEPLFQASHLVEDCGSRVHLTVLARQATERGWSYSVRPLRTTDSDLVSERETATLARRLHSKLGH